MTELEAVNMMLRELGSSKVNNLSSSHPDIANCQDTLSRLREQEQRSPWWFNTDYNVTFQRDTANEISIADAIDSVVWQDDLLVVRGGKLYNSYDQTYVFDCDVTAYRVVRLLDWDELPGTMQDYLMYSAAAEVVRTELEDTGKQNSLLEQAGRARIKLQAQDLREGKHNVFRNARILRTRAGVRPSRTSISSVSRYLL